MMAKSFAETHPRNLNATCKCEHWQSCIDCHPTAHSERYITDAMKVRQAVSNAVLQESKDGSPCPEFWDWLTKAYNFDGNGAFTKYNMEVAFLAGKQASQPEQHNLTEQEHDVLMSAIKSSSTVVSKGFLAQPKKEPFGYFQYSIQLDAWVQNRINNKGVAFYTTPSQRTWVGLTEDEILLISAECASSHQHTDIHFARAIEAKLRSKNS